MSYPQMTMQEKKKLLKLLAFRFYMHVIQSAIFWMIVGFIISTISMSYLMVNTLSEIDKIMVCK
jgi:hypothetical protein